MVGSKKKGIRTAQLVRDELVGGLDAADVLHVAVQGEEVLQCVPVRLRLAQVLQALVKLLRGVGKHHLVVVLVHHGLAFCRNGE